MDLRLAVLPCCMPGHSALLSARTFCSAACQDILDSMYEFSTRATLHPLARGR